MLINKIINKTIRSKMKIFYILFLSILFVSQANAQVVINSKFKPFSYEELMLYAEAQAARSAYNEQKFKEYKEIAYDALNHGNKHGFITYSNYALQTGWYNAKLYYDRGEVFLSLGDYKQAKKEYKKVKRKGYYLAEEALQKFKFIRQGNKCITLIKKQQE